MDDRQYRQILAKVSYRDQLDALTDLLYTTEAGSPQLAAGSVAMN